MVTAALPLAPPPAAPAALHLPPSPTALSALSAPTLPTLPACPTDAIAANVAVVSADEVQEILKERRDGGAGDFPVQGLNDLRRVRCEGVKVSGVRYEGSQAVKNVMLQPTLVATVATSTLNL